MRSLVVVIYVGVVVCVAVVVMVVVSAPPLLPDVVLDSEEVDVKDKEKNITMVRKMTF